MLLRACRVIQARWRRLVRLLRWYMEGTRSQARLLQSEADALAIATAASPPGASPHNPIHTHIRVWVCRHTSERSVGSSLTPLFAPSLHRSAARSLCHPTARRVWSFTLQPKLSPCPALPVGPPPSLCTCSRWGLLAPRHRLRTPPHTPVLPLPPTRMHTSSAHALDMPSTRGW